MIVEPIVLGGAAQLLVVLGSYLLVLVFSGRLGSSRRRPRPDCVLIPAP